MLVHLLPYLEQGQTYNAINFKSNIWWSLNHTVHATGIAAYWCPSDGTVRVGSSQLPTGHMVTPPPGSGRMAYSSYASVCGPWYTKTLSIPGVFGARSPATSHLHSKNPSRWECSI